MRIMKLLRNLGLTVAAALVVAGGLSGARIYAVGAAVAPQDHGFKVFQDWVDCDLTEDAEVRYVSGSETFTVALKLQDSDDYLAQSKIDQGEKVTLTDPNTFAYKETRDYEVVAFNKDTPAEVVGSFSDTAPTKKYCADQPPIAKNDRRTTPQNQTIVIAVLRNDVDPEVQALKVIDVDDPAIGKAKIVENGTKVEYTPGKDDCNGAWFGYGIADPAGHTSYAHITVDIDRSTGTCHQ